MALSENARRFLEEQRFATLASLLPDGAPLLTVMWYIVRDDHILMNVSRGLRKERNLRRERRASICVEDGYRYVTVSGTVELVDDQEISHADIAALATRYLGPKQAERMIADVFAKIERVSIILPLTKIYERGLAGGETFRREEDDGAG
jgi:PPOX class probable F420-dependent enzyme